MGIPRKEAEERLGRGDISFILAADVSRLGELGNLRSPAPFYGGLLAEDSSPPHAAILFVLALDSQSPLVREAAARKLVPLVLESRDRALANRIRRVLGNRKREAPGAASAALECAAAFTLGRFAELAAREKAGGGEKISTGKSFPPWEGILCLAGTLAVEESAGKEDDASSGGGRAEKLADLLFQNPSGKLDRWAFGQGGSSPIAGFPEKFGQTEYAALTGRLAAARSSYEEALTAFRTVIEQNAGLFFRYPELLSDLGRVFQFSGARDEGIALFGEWDRRFQAGEEQDIPLDRQGPARYRLRYFAGRMERQRGRLAQAAEFFTRALEFAPDAEQKDACIWYILDTTLSQGKDILPLLERYIPQWHDPAYFEDILVRLCRTLAAGRQWKAMLSVFSLLRPPGQASLGRPSLGRPTSGGSITGQYAYILGRAVEEGLLSRTAAAEALTTQGGAAVKPEDTAAEFFKAARDEGGGVFYYRALASARLGTTLTPETAPNEERADFPHPETMEFLLDFFRFGAGQFAAGYLRDVPEKLTPAELRALAEAFQDAHYWAEAMRIVAAYMFQPGYAITRRDLELYYPRPFQVLVESNAKETGVPVTILYGLIRTESAFEAAIRSRAGALGLTQLMPATAREMASRLSRQGGPDYAGSGDIDLRNPLTNIHLGAYYLSYLMNRMENPLLAILAYNGGMGRVRRWRAAESRLPADLFPETIEVRETRDYGRKVLTAAAAYGYLYYTMTMEAVLADISK